MGERENVLLHSAWCGFINTHTHTHQICFIFGGREYFISQGYSFFIVEQKKRASIQTLFHFIFGKKKERKIVKRRKNLHLFRQREKVPFLFKFSLTRFDICAECVRPHSISISRALSIIVLIKNAK